MIKFVIYALLFFIFAVESQTFSLEPETPERPTVALSETFVTVSWQSVTGANGYYIQTIRDNYEIQDLLTGSPHIHSFTDSASYKFKVKACNGVYDGQPIPEDPPVAMSRTSKNPFKSINQSHTSNSSEVCSAWSEPSSTVSGAPPSLPQVTYIHTDILGSVIAESDRQGNIIKRTGYKPFGQSKEQ